MIKRTPTGLIHTMDDDAEPHLERTTISVPRKTHPKPKMIAALAVMKRLGGWVRTGIIAREIRMRSNAYSVLMRLVHHKQAERRTYQGTSEWRAL